MSRKNESKPKHSHGIGWFLGAVPLAPFSQFG